MSSLARVPSVVVHVACRDRLLDVTGSVDALLTSCMLGLYAIENGASFRAVLRQMLSEANAKIACLVRAFQLNEEKLPVVVTVRPASA